MKVNWRHIGIKIDLDNLRDYLLDLSTSLDSSTKVFIAKVDAEAAAMSEESRDAWYEWNSDIHWQLTDVYPAILNNSLFIIIYSYLESSLLDFSRRLESQNPQPVKMKELRGEGIELCRTYLKKVHAIDFPDTSIEWQRITVYRKIRNFIVHNDRKLDGSENAKVVRDFATQNPKLISIDQFDQIAVSTQCNIDFIDVIYEFLMKLLSKTSL
ncbi:MAG: hypothetical protein KJ069_16130 [Anaerolineae bacterium]|nr:hypothetical protein [Anaerolineae bacterium]